MYTKLINFSVLLAFVVIVLGAYVRLSDAGLGCPDWPGCYGQATPAHAAADIAAAQTARPGGPVSFHKAWKEMIHRYFASTLGLLIIGIASLAWRRHAISKQSITLPFSLIGLVVLQGLLGMWTVTLLLKPAIVTAHLLCGLTLLALLVLLALRQYQGGMAAGIIAASSTRWLAAAAFAILAMQVVLGGWVSTNYAALICTDFPRCQGVLVPKMDFANAFHIVRELGMTAQGDLLSLEALTAIHWMHRVGALLTVGVMGLLALRLLTDKGSYKLGILVLVMLTMQVSIGIGNIFLNLPLALAVAHNAGAALLVVVMVIVNFVLHRAPSGAKQLIGERSTAAAGF